MIRPCPTCKPHEFQDQTYGLNVRVWNQCGSPNCTGYRCTVCGITTKESAKPEPKKIESKS